MIIRPIRRDDAEALCSLWNRSAPHDPLTLALLHEKVWGDTSFDLQTALVAEHEGVCVGFGLGMLRPAADEYRGYIKLLAVDPRHRRKGIGGKLLASLEENLWMRGATVLRVCESAPNYLTPGLDVRYTFGMLFFEKHGYKRFGETYNLDVDLTTRSFDTSTEERQLLKQGRTIRRATLADNDGVMALLQAQWSPWQAEVATCFTNSPISLHIALAEDRVVGFSAYDTNNLGTAWFGPMGTAPSERGLGIGGVLFQRCLRDMRDHGHTRSIIPWVGPIGFYAHYANATIARVFYRYEKRPDIM